MTTLTIRKVGRRERKLATLGGEPGSYAVSDGEKILATGRSRLLSDEHRIEAGGRRLTANMKRKGRSLDEVAVVDDATGEMLIDGRRISGSFRDQEWAMTLRAGRTISWIYRAALHKLGFFDADGGPIMQMGHDPSFDAPTKATTLRILLRFWGGAIASQDRFIATVDDGAVGRAVAAEDVPILALLGMWLEKAAEVTDADTMPG